MTTETDPQIDVWSDRLEEELVEVGMEPPQARAFARAFELGMNRVLSVVATKQELLGAKDELRGEIAGVKEELQREIAGVKEELQREMELRFGEMDKRLRLMTWAMGLGFAGMLGMMAAILSRL